VDDIERELRALFEDAVSLALKARQAFAKAPTVRSQRGGPRLHPMFKVWSEAVQNACRLARALGVRPTGGRTLDDELGRLLEDMDHD
jgi:phage terminase small subunit